jgi:ribosomal-protein-alanine N-acetyltransferase
MDRIGAFTIRQMAESDAREIAGWRYDHPYDVYNCAHDEFEETVRCFLLPQNRYHSVWDEAGQLVGFLCFGEDGRVPGGDYRAPALDIGGGLRPDLTGHGLGSSFMQAALALARRHFAPAAFRVTVASFNKRALRVCENVGYRQVQAFDSTHNGKPFIVLMRDAG